MRGKDAERYPYTFLLLYALIYMTNAIYNNFVPIYLEHVGFSNTVIGMLLSLGPFIAIVAQPIWGISADRARTKNTILALLLLGSAISIIMYPISISFYYLLFIMAVFTFFQTSVVPMSDAITLEYLEHTKWTFGPIRMAGTIGYAIMSIVAGIVVKWYMGGIFALYFTIALMAFIVVLGLPKVEGHQFRSRRMATWELFKDSELMLLMLFNFIIQATLGFYYNFFPIYYKQMGADTALLGWAMFISAISEVPFLLFSDKILKKIGTRYTLLGSAVVTSVRWLMLYFSFDPYIVLPFQTLHGFMFIVFAFSLATYINQEVPKELKASGQTLNGLITMGIARITGSLAGGMLSDIVGIKQVFLYNAILAAASAVIFGAVFIKDGIRVRRQFPEN